MLPTLYLVCFAVLCGIAFFFVLVGLSKCCPCALLLIALVLLLRIA